MVEKRASTFSVKNKSSPYNINAILVHVVDVETAALKCRGFDIHHVHVHVSSVVNRVAVAAFFTVFPETRIIGSQSSFILSLV